MTKISICGICVLAAILLCSSGIALPAHALADDMELVDVKARLAILETKVEELRIAFERSTGTSPVTQPQEPSQPKITIDWLDQYWRELSADGN